MCCQVLGQCSCKENIAVHKISPHAYRIAGIFRGVKFSWIWKIFRVRGFVYACTNERGSLHLHVYGNCFVGKYFVVYFSTTKTTKILTPEKHPLYGI